MAFVHDGHSLTVEAQFEHGDGIVPELNRNRARNTAPISTLSFAKDGVLYGVDYAKRVASSLGLDRYNVSGTVSCESLVSGPTSSTSISICPKCGVFPCARICKQSVTIPRNTPTRRLYRTFASKVFRSIRAYVGDSLRCGVANRACQHALGGNHECQLTQPPESGYGHRPSRKLASGNQEVEYRGTVAVEDDGSGTYRSCPGS